MRAISRDKLLETIDERLTYATDMWREIREQARIDMRFVAGDPWDQADKDQRAGRPMIAPEEMGQYFNQVINDLRANPRGMKFSPVGNGANDKTAEFYQDKAREIEYRSHAKIAYLAAAENAIQRSYGFCRVTTKYVSDRSSNQELWIESLPNPDLVLPDPDALRPDSSDIKYCFVLQWTPTTEFERDYPDATVRDFDGYESSAPQWFRDSKILLAEYWTIETVRKRLLLIQPWAPKGQPALAPREVLDDEVPEQATIIKTQRTVEIPSVVQYLTNGLEILKTTPWPGKYIPIISCYGKVIYVDEGSGTKRKILSMTRFGRDPWKAYCYACSQELEILGMIPKVPVQAATGQMRGHEAEWQKAMHEPMAFLYYNPTTEATGAQVLSPPSRIDYPAGAHLQSLEIVKEGFRRAIQAAMGSNFLPTMAQRRNEKSGVALQKIADTAQKGTFHFIDNFDTMIRQVALVIENLMDKIHDYTGDTGVMDDLGQARTVRINDPQARDAQGQPAVIMTKGDYLVTVSTGPSSDSEREAASDFVDTFIGSPLLQVLGPQAGKAVAQAIRMKNLGPQGEALADLIDPPQGEANPQQLQQHMQQMTQQLQEAKSIIEQAQQEKQTEAAKYLAQAQIEQMKQQATIEKANVEADTALALQAMRNAATIAAAHIAASAKGVSLTAHAAEETQALGHEADQAAFGRSHDLTMATLDHATTLREQQQAHDQVLAQGAQAAALAPAPETQAGA